MKEKTDAAAAAPSPQAQAQATGGDKKKAAAGGNLSLKMSDLRLEAAHSLASDDKIQNLFLSANFLNLQSDREVAKYVFFSLRWERFFFGVTAGLKPSFQIYTKTCRLAYAHTNADGHTHTRTHASAYTRRAVGANLA